MIIVSRMTRNGNEEIAQWLIGLAALAQGLFSEYRERLTTNYNFGFREVDTLHFPWRAPSTQVVPIHM